MAQGKKCHYWVAAKEAGETTYFTGEPCRRGHIARRWTAGRQCLDCCKVHAPKFLLYRKGWNAENRDRICEQSRIYYEQHKERVIARTRSWALDNPEKVLGYGRAWDKNHPIERRARTIAYSRAIKGQTPVWADWTEIYAVYGQARKLTETTGIPHDVDHIVPLLGKNVRGLHIAWNLRAIPAGENRRKSNKHNT